MEKYEGLVRMVGESDSVAASAAVSDDRLRIAAGDVEIGTWELGDIDLEFRDNEWHVGAEGEYLILTLTAAADFAEAVRRARPKDPKPEVFSPGPLRTAMAGLLRLVQSQSARTQLAAAGVAAWLVAFAVLPWLAIGLLVVLSSLLMIVGLYATLDPFIAVRVPASPTTLIAVGGGVLAVIVGVALLT